VIREDRQKELPSREYVYQAIIFHFGSWERAQSSSDGRAVIERYLLMGCTYSPLEDARSGHQPGPGIYFLG
jgi:hypothetical protein